jgi:uncharacterized membrane protein YeiH
MFETIGIIAFSLSGYLAATKKELDILGVFIISFSTALGGGIIRDLSINRIPASFLTEWPFLLVLLTIIIGYLLKAQKYSLESKKLFIYADSIGLISFSVTGAFIGIENNLSVVGVLMLSLITGTGGGVIRDMLLQKKISLLKEDIYGTFSIIIGLYIFYINYFLYVFLITLFILRLYVKNKNLSLPTLKKEIKNFQGQ